MELLQNFKYVKVKHLTPYKYEVLEGIKDAVEVSVICNCSRPLNFLSCLSPLQKDKKSKMFFRSVSENVESDWRTSLNREAIL